jgi:hypothetical protein
MDEPPAEPRSPEAADGPDTPEDLRSALPGGRRGWTLRQRLRAPDSYGLLLVLILLSMLSIAGLADGSWERTLSALVLAFTLLFALYTSRAPRRTMIAAYAILPLVVVGAGFASYASGKVSHVVPSALILALLLGVLVAILLRMGTHATISWHTVLAGICIYLLVGLIFASLFSVMGWLNDGVLFAGGQAPSTLNTTYFSFTTLSTVGYGDLSMADGLPKMLSVTEAVLGQVYLVVAVGLLIGNLGRTRPRRPPEVPAQAPTSRTRGSRTR